MSRKQPTEAQREAAQRRRERFRAMVKDVAAMSTEQRESLAETMGAVVTCEGRTLSIFNTCLLVSQFANPTIVGGFRQWRGQGRSVRKGEHGLMIWIPSKRKPEATPDTSADDDAETVRFFMGTVFDVSQTIDVETGALESVGAA